MSATKIQATKKYDQFLRANGENRPLDLKRHKALRESMARYGFLRCYPIVVARDEKDRLIIKDGQHRLAIAEELGLTVHWIEDGVDFDVALVNSTAKVWALRDYAQKHAANGLEAYRQGLDFAEAHRLPIGTAFALLAGTTTFNNLREEFMGGSFEVKDQAWADAVAGIYTPMTVLAHCLRSARFIEACMAVCRVSIFSPKRLLINAERCREKLASYSTRDAYLDMMESVYNFGRKELVGLKSLAVMAMRDRNIAVNPRRNGKSREPALAAAE